ncbi:hypothetical protein [Aureivirga sp. CE67]|uniref:hypothetical protein n=1 Tax=Aureivirga sp. CE67 TaxID=1788983 RepID=UPI0018CA3D8A|nr:hypothetical protein [Aureivirga sp. CE67]
MYIVYICIYSKQLKAQQNYNEQWLVKLELGKSIENSNYYSFQVERLNSEGLGSVSLQFDYLKNKKQIDKIKEETKITGRYLSVNYNYSLEKYIKIQNFKWSIGGGVLLAYESMDYKIVQEDQWGYGVNLQNEFLYYIWSNIGVSVTYKQSIFIESLYARTFPMIGVGVKLGL